MIASPADPLDTVHTAMLLSSVAPILRREARQLVTEIAQHQGVEREIIDEKRRLASATSALQQERATLPRFSGSRKHGSQWPRKDRQWSTG